MNRARARSWQRSRKKVMDMRITWEKDTAGLAVAQAVRINKERKLGSCDWKGTTVMN